MPYVLFLLICVIWSGSFLLMKKAALVFSPISIGAWRVTGGVAVLATGIAFLAAALHHPGRAGARIYGGLISLLSLTGAVVDVLVEVFQELLVRDGLISPEVDRLDVVPALP